jgi:PhnB protein
MIIITPVLNFSGQCEEAIALYKEAFDAQTTLLLRYTDANLLDWDQHLTDAQKRLVYHAEMVIGTQRIMLSDIIDHDLTQGTAQFLTVTFDDAAGVKKAYEFLKEGGTIIYPMTSTTYSSCFVSLIDKFGIRWGLMTEQTER